MARRTLLFSPGDRPEMLRKAVHTDADCLVFDLEDSVALARKSTARNAVSELLFDPDFDPDAEVYVRPSRVDRDADIEAICGPDSQLDGVVCSKVADPSEIEAVASAAAEYGPSIDVLALVETAAGVLNAAEIAAAGPTEALIFGAEDFAADVGATRSNEGTEVLYAREHVVVAATAAGIDAIDTVYPDFRDESGLAAATEQAAGLGYDGKLAIHPAQVPIINAAFRPAPERVEWARRVLSAAEDAEDDDRGVFEVDGEMIDTPLVEQAKQVLDRASTQESPDR